MAENSTVIQTPYQNDLQSRIFDLVIGRVFKDIYLNLDLGDREDMEKIFLSEDSKGKEKFLRKHKLNFKKIFDEETKKIEEEIKAEIEKQV